MVPGICRSGACLPGVLKRFLPVLLLPVLLLPVSSVEASRRGRTHRRELRWEGRRRDLELYLPRPGGSFRALVLALHGGGGTPASMAYSDGHRFEEIADTHDLVIAYPGGYARRWNDGRGIASYPAHREDVDDVGFLGQLVRDLLQEFRIPRENVFMTGISNGGLMTRRFACEAPELVAAVAPVISNRSVQADALCRETPPVPVPILVVNGTEDPLIPHSGGPARFLGKGLGTFLSTRDGVAAWVRRNGCTPEPEEEWLPDLDPGDGTRTRWLRYAGCHGGASVELLEVVGGGHVWPGGRWYAPRFLVGRIPRDFHASDRIWAFFRRFLDGSRQDPAP